MSKDATAASAPSEETPPTDVTSSGASARGPCLPMAADVKKTGGCKTHTVEHSDSDGPDCPDWGHPQPKNGRGARSTRSSPEALPHWPDAPDQPANHVT